MPLDRPIPAFYCCYLLRSTVRHSHVYVGSTPNPVRRVRQHNGGVKGGAARTNRPNLRPWEMTCIVTGFPSQIAALQFEWAWQNPHVTLHIPSESRIQHATAKKRSGQPKRPRHSVTSLLSNLHLLLRVPSFARWPLEVRFFSEDVHKAWVRWSSTATEPIRESLEVIKDLLPHTTIDPPNAAQSPSSPHGGIGALDINYTANRPHVEKGKNVIDFEREGSCSLCQTELAHDAGIYTICANPSCEAVTHLTCLSKHFLSSEGEGDDVMVPIRGHCPSCKTEMKWVDIVKELTLRMRGQKEVEKLLKKKKKKKKQVKKANESSSAAAASSSSTSQAMAESSADDDDDADADVDAHDYESLDEDNEIEDEVNDFLLDIAGGGGGASDNWHEIDDDSESDTESILIITTSSHAQSQHPSSELPSSLVPVKTTTLPIVIEDSDWDDAEVLD